MTGVQTCALPIFKNSAVALTIGLMELTARARSMQEFSFQVFEAFTIATIIYLLVNLVVVLLMRMSPMTASAPSDLRRKDSAKYVVVMLGP